MPTSNLAHAIPILNLVETIDPHPETILDVGPGWGKYATLLREYLNHPPTKIDAVEVHEPYVHDHRLAALYDVVAIGDACDLTPALLATYDLVLMVDVIEHLDKDRALALLDRIPGWVVICTPVEFFSNGPGLPDSETHRSHWTADDWDALAARVDVICYDVENAWIVRLSPQVTP